VKINES
jgi:hypothetical protein